MKTDLFINAIDPARPTMEIKTSLALILRGVIQHGHIPEVCQCSQLPLGRILPATSWSFLHRVLQYKPVIRIAAEMFSLCMSLRLNAFANHEQEACAWLKRKEFRHDTLAHFR